VNTNSEESQKSRKKETDKKQTLSCQKVRRGEKKGKRIALGFARMPPGDFEEERRERQKTS